MRLEKARRRLAEWIAPPGVSPVDAIYPRTLELVQDVATRQVAGSIKHLIVAKQLARETGASNLNINTAIERAVRAIRAPSGD